MVHLRSGSNNTHSKKSTRKSNQLNSVSVSIECPGTVFSIKSNIIILGFINVDIVNAVTGVLWDGHVSVYRETFSVNSLEVGSWISRL